MNEPETTNPARERILSTAMEVFAEQGFEGARVDDIAARAGVNKAMLYYHVGDKEALYLACVSSILDRAHRLIVSAAEEAQTPVDAIRAIQAAFLRMMEEVPHYAPVMLREIATGGRNLPREVLQQFLDIILVTADAVRAGQESGIFRDAHPLAVHLAIVGTSIFVTRARLIAERMRALGIDLPMQPADFTSLGASVGGLLIDGLVAHQERSES